MLNLVKELVPVILPFVHSAYSISLSLFWGYKILESAEVVQKGDSLGSLLFCLTIHYLTSQLISEFHVFYLDDGTLGGIYEPVIQDHRLLEYPAKQLGLKLNKLTAISQ